MNYDIKEEPGQNLITIDTRGAFDLDIMVRIVSTLESFPLYRTGASIFVDFTQLDLTALTTDQVKTLSHEVSALAFQNPKRKCAFLVSSNLHDYGLARMWEIQTQDFVRASLKIFQNRDEALSWLQMQGNDD